jgi:[ribosomal protein S5]-alanine N-acetyltransferase
MNRVIIRRVARTDATALIAGHIHSSEFHAPWMRNFADQDGFDARYDGLATGANAALIAHELADGPLVGVFTITGIIMGRFRSGYLAYYAMREAAGRGLMTEALALVIRYAFGEIGLHRLEANIQPGNERSIALVRRAGFQKEGFSPRYLQIDGEWRDHERWALLAD